MAAALLRDDQFRHIGVGSLADLVIVHSDLGAAGVAGIEDMVSAVYRGSQAV